MSIHRRSTTAVSAAALLLAIGAGIALAQRFEPTVTRATVCVKNNGQMRMSTGTATACDPSEQLVEWVLGGELTDIRTGQGLAASREGGIVNLGLDPTFLETCAGCGRIFAGYGYDDQEGIMPYGIEQLAELELPAGSYAIFAKIVLRRTDDLGEGAGTRFVRCRLTAENDSDEADTSVEKLHVEPDDHSVDGLTELGLNLQVVHHFATAVAVTVSCGELTNFITHNVRFRHLKIIAIEAGNISNVFLGGN
jgi:hypothetical protein